MYKIIGADQKEYGPVSADEIRQWIAEGRVAGHTKTQAAGTTDWKTLKEFPEFNLPSASPAPPPLPVASDGISTLIPYRNTPALVAYYLAVFSLIPCVGAVLGIAACVFGLLGLKRASQNPNAKGKVHAWIGILVGGFFGLAYTVVAVLIFWRINHWDR